MHGAYFAVPLHVGENNNYNCYYYYYYHHRRLQWLGTRSERKREVALRVDRMEKRVVNGVVEDQETG